jgi:hypothetical protein
MVTILTSNQIRTMRHSKSYRSCPTSTGLPIMGVDRGRMLKEEVARGNRELRRRWLTACWKNRHQCYR